MGNLCFKASWNQTLPERSPGPLLPWQLVFLSLHADLVGRDREGSSESMSIILYQEPRPPLDAASLEKNSTQQRQTLPPQQSLQSPRWG